MASRPTILIIDDERDVRTPMRQMLEGTGYVVEEASDGDEGIEKCRTNPPDLVIVDIFMPNKSGLEVIEELRRGYPDVRIIAISGVDTRDGLDLNTLTRGYGVARAIEKPFLLKDLLEAVVDVLAS
ncbi:MAG: response regulator [Candidatus Latescibacteria bacterium]|jgi:CheY-like chemotaxis protein|nr:response regulator [Candidatus Latescibacterota bacterium]